METNLVAGEGRERVSWESRANVGWVFGRTCGARDARTSARGGRVRCQLRFQKHGRRAEGRTFMLRSPPGRGGTSQQRLLLSVWVRET